MANHNRHISDENFKNIKEKLKISEAYLHNNNNNSYHRDQIVKYINYNLGELHVKIIDVTHYENFEEMLNNEMSNVLPQCKNIEEGLLHYRKLYTNLQEELRHGVVVIHIDLIQDSSIL